MTPQEFRAIRRTLGLSQWQLAEALKTQAGKPTRPEIISRLETGKQPISVKLAQRLLDLAGLAQCPTCGHPHTIFSLQVTDLWPEEMAEASVADAGGCR